MAGLILLLLGGLMCWPSLAEIVEYTESDEGPGQIALGYPVPRPLDSPTPFAGFRSYDSLIQRLTALSFSDAALGGVKLGKSERGEDVLGFVFGVQEAGQAPAMLQVGTLHAREWAAPEVVSFIAEALVARRANQGIEQFLANQTSILLVPVLNPDGLRITQAHASSTRVGEDIGPDPQTPRDGRMRRKNARNTDGDLETTVDTLDGVDLNRNFGPYWNTSTRSSPNRRSLVYHGEAEASEAETQALLAAANRLGGGQLRLFIDTHSFGRVLIYNDTGNPALTRLSAGLGQRLRQVPARAYGLGVASNDSGGYGSSDEYFAHTFEIPAYTLELEPGSQQAEEYGGNAGVSHSGFILPEDQIERVRQEIYAMSVLAFYHQAGPPILEQVSVLEPRSGAMVYRARWQGRNGERQLETHGASLQPGQAYRLQLQFSKPMRLLDQDHQVKAYPGQGLPTPPVIRLRGESQVQLLETDGRWLQQAYAGDLYEIEFTVAADLGPSAQLAVQATDLSGLALDARPASLSTWQAGHWINYEDSQGLNSDQGGEDSQICLPLDPDAISGCSPMATGGSGGSGRSAIWLLLIFALCRRCRTA